MTIALSTRGRGAHGAPSGVTTSFRPPRFLNVIGMCTVIVSPSAETAARLLVPPPVARHFPHQAGQPVRPKPDLHAVHPHLDPLDQQLHDPRLLGREQLVPQRVELQQRLPRLVLGDVVLLGPRRAPRADDDLRLPEDAAQLVDDRRLDLGRRHPPDRARLRPALQHVLADVVAVEPVPFRVCVGDMAAPVGPKISPFSSAGVCARVRADRVRALSARIACTLSHSA